MGLRDGNFDENSEHREWHNVDCPCEDCCVDCGYCAIGKGFLALNDVGQCEVCAAGSYQHAAPATKEAV